LLQQRLKKLNSYVRSAKELRKKLGFLLILTLLSVTSLL